MRCIWQDSRSFSIHTNKPRKAGCFPIVLPFIHWKQTFLTHNKLFDCYRFLVEYWSLEFKFLIPRAFIDNSCSLLLSLFLSSHGTYFNVLVASLSPFLSARLATFKLTLFSLTYSYLIILFSIESDRCTKPYCGVYSPNNTHLYLATRFELFFSQFSAGASSYWLSF